MLEFFNDVENIFDGDETGEEQINYQLLLAAQDCLNIIVQQFHKLEPVAHGLKNEFDRDSFQERLKFLEYGACMEVFIYQTDKYYLLITAFAKRIKSSKLLNMIADQEPIIFDKVHDYIEDNKTLTERIISGQPYVSPVEFIAEGKVTVKDEIISVYPQEISPLFHSWNVATREYKKYRGK